MDKAQAIHAFWSSFGIPAYDKTTVPEDAGYPRLTYDVSTAQLGTKVALTASLWYHSTTWEDISQKADEISAYIENMNPPATKIDGGRIYIKGGTPFAQRMADPDPFIRRMVIYIDVEYFTST